jgi:transposase
MMFRPSGSTRVYLAPGATDMRKSINGLSLLVADVLELDPLSGHLFVFCNRKQDRIKILYWERNGFCLWHKRLEKDRFHWPETVEAVLTVRGYESAWLLDGLTLKPSGAHRERRYEIVS